MKDQKRWMQITDRKKTEFADVLIVDTQFFMSKIV